MPTKNQKPFSSDLMMLRRGRNWIVEETMPSHVYYGEKLHLIFIEAE